MRRLSKWSLMAGLTAVAIGFASAMTWAQPPAATIRGKVQSFTTAPKGEVDGAVLTDGTYIHWPPHMGERMAAIVKVGDTLASTGRWEQGPEGDRRLEAQRVSNTSTDASLEVDGPRGPARRSGSDDRRGEAKTSVGRIKELTTAPRGEIDGAVLANGTVLHWPPHLEERFRAVASVGAEVKATGVTETTPRGDTHFEVESLTNLDSKQTVVNDDAPRPPRVGRGAGPQEKASHEERLRDLQRKMDRLQRELDDLRRSE